MDLIIITIEGDFDYFHEVPRKPAKLIIYPQK